VSDSRHPPIHQHTPLPAAPCPSPQVKVELPPEALAVADWGGVSPQAAMTITAPGMDRQLLVRLQAPPLEGALK
jgi:hypothetical protein